MLLYVIRHGDPIYDPDSLTELGHKQAKALSKRLCVHGLDKIYSSPLIRAQQTAQPTCEALGLPCEIEEWASENLAYKDFCVDHTDGRRTWCFHQQTTNFLNEETARREDWYNIPALLGDPETFKRGFERIAKSGDEFLARLGYVREGMAYRIERPNDDRVALFCHEGISTLWLPHVLNVPPQIFWGYISFSHSSVTILNFENNKNGITLPSVLCTSDLSHIYESGLPYKHKNIIDI